MEIKLNIQKTHFWILLAVIVLIGAGIFVYAQANTQGHPWGEITGIPAGFADGTDDTGGGTLSCQNLPKQTSTSTDTIQTDACETLGVGYVLTGGGCNSGKNIIMSMPAGGTGGSWKCKIASAENSWTAYARCCKVI